MSDCVHLGSYVGEQVLCPACRKRTMIKLFTCAVYGKCSIKVPLKDVACCNGAITEDGTVEPCDYFSPRNDTDEVGLRSNDCTEQTR